ncbi:MAG TPA: TonB-dependent receptor [Pseudomonadota bacterium]|nr:TonB-dependent receptor [Pseudomonadota bacterium]
MRTTPLRAAIRRSLQGAAALAVAATPMAQAQDQDQDQDSPEQLETVTVLGSRIKRTDIETSQPVLVIERAELARTGLTSIGDILQELTSAGATLNSSINNAGNGETRADLRNLGSNRVLVLVNGRRWVQSASGGVIGTGVDLSTIPISIVERVEVLKDGASSIYGSDAIAGVINITTRDTFDGAEASAYIGEYDEGDGRTESYDFTLGATTDRSSVVLNVSYTKQEVVGAGDREISAVPTFGLPSGTVYPGGPSSTTPQGRFGFGAGGNRLPDGSAGTLTLSDGQSGDSASDFRPFSTATDGYNFAPDNYLLTPQERIGLYAQGRYDLTESIGFRTEVLYNERRSELLLAPTPIVLGTLGSGGAFGVNIDAESVYNPFGQDITRAQFRPLGRGRSFNQDVDAFHFAGGFDGAFDLWERSFSWDASYIYNESEQNDTNFGAYNVGNIAQGVGPSFVDGGVATCGTPDAPIAGCVPLNFLGGPDGFTQEMFDYAAIVIHDSGGYKSTNYTTNITGDLFELPAGPLGFAAGYEYRRESGYDSPDAFVAAGLSTGSARLPTEGGYSVDEFYVEFNVPILKDLPGAEILEINAAARYSDYSSFGDTTNPKIGFRWKPVSDLLVRGSYADGFRAPNITELFGGQADSFPDIADPCDAANLELNPDPSANCFNGIGGVAPVPPGYEISNSQVRATVGSNPNLTPETATTKTLGLVYSPNWAEGLDVYLDWYDIEIENTIAAPTAQFLLTDCYVNSTLSSCALITRNPASGDILDMLALAANNGTLTQEGYDVTFDYRFDTSYGKFRVNWASTYISEYITEIPLGSGPLSVVGNYFQFFPVWRLKSNIDLNWQYGDWGATFGARYLSALDESCTSAVLAGVPEVCSDPDGTPTFGGPENEIDDTWYFDIQGAWDTPWNGRITAGINNLFDEDPPISYSAFANSFDPQYELPGRFWYASYTQKF